MRTGVRTKGSLVLAVLITTGLLCWHRYAPPAAGSHHEVAPGAPSAQAKADAAWPATLAYRLQPGRAYLYELRRDTHVVRGGAPYASVDGEGTLRVDVVRSTAGHADAIVTIEFGGTASAAKTNSRDSKQAPLNVSSSARLRIGPTGRVEALAFRREDAAPEHTRVFNDLLSTWLYTLPDPSKAARDQGVEGQDGNGVYVAKYSELSGRAAPFELAMSKQSYAKATLPTRIIKSEHRLRWDLSEGHLLEARSEEHLGKGDKELKIVARDSAEIKFVRTSPSQSQIAQLERYSVDIPVYVERTAAVAHSQPAGGVPVRPWQELQREIKNLPADPESEKPMEVFMTLSASLQADPSMLLAVVEETKAHDSQSKPFQMLIGAISDLGTPEAQQGLIDMYETRDSTGKDMVLKGQLLMEEPATPETRTMLLHTYDNEPDPELKGVAGLALGSSLQNAGDDPTIATTHARIMRMWSEAVMPGEKQYVLDVIGNSGDPYFMPLLSAEIQDPTSIVRQAAIAALRFMNTEESAQLLMHAITLTDAPYLQLSALSALVHHGWRPEFYEPLASCFLAPQQSDVRIGCATVVMQQRPLQQQMQAVLQTARDSGNADESVREFIRTQLL